MGLGNFVELLRSVDRLLTLEAKHGAAIQKLATELSGLKEQIVRLEAREEITIEKAKSAASAAASAALMVSASDIALRVGRLEERSQSPIGAPPKDGRSKRKPG